MSIPFTAFPHLISLSYFEKVIAIYQSRAFLLSSTARTRELFFAVSRAAERRVVGRGKMTHCTSHLYATSPCLHCSRSHRKWKHVFFLLWPRFKRILPVALAWWHGIFL